MDLRRRRLQELAERELFAALVSVGNRCGYCAGVHCSIAGVVLGAGVVDDVVHDRDDEEILEAVHAAVLLEICNRVVNALGVEPMGPAQNRRAPRFLLHHDYDL